MDELILLFFFVLSIVLFIFCLRKQPIKEWLLSFLLTAYFAYILGAIVVELGWIQYLALGDYVNGGYLYELLLLPVINTYFYQTSYRSTVRGILFQCVLYTTGLTIVEVILEKYTELIEFVSWHWTYTLFSVFGFMLAIRFLLKLINQKSR